MEDTESPTQIPTQVPTQAPSMRPTTKSPSASPTSSPSTSAPTLRPTLVPTKNKEDKNAPLRPPPTSVAPVSPPIHHEATPPPPPVLPELPHHAIVGHLSLAMSLFIPTPQNQQLEFEKLEGPIVHWISDFLCEQPETRIVTADSWKDICFITPMPVVPGHTDFILGNEVGILYNAQGLMFDLEDREYPQSQQYSRWNWTFPIHQWGYYNDADSPSSTINTASLSIQAALDEKLIAEPTSLDLPWNLAQASVVGMELQTFTTYRPKSTSTGSDGGWHFDPKSTEVFVVQCIGILMMIWNVIAVYGLTQYVKYAKQDRDAKSKEQQKQSGLQSAQGVDQMLHATRGIVGLENLSPSSASSDNIKYGVGGSHAGSSHTLVAGNTNNQNSGGIKITAWTGSGYQSGGNDAPSGSSAASFNGGDDTSHLFSRDYRPLAHGYEFKDNILSLGKRGSNRDDSGNGMECEYDDGKSDEDLLFCPC